MQVKRLAFYRVQDNPVYRVVRRGVFGKWGLFIACIFVPEVIGSFKGNKGSALIVLVIVAIIIGTTLPASLKNDAKAEIISHASAYTHQLIDYGGSRVAGLAAGLKTLQWLQIDITKAAHFLLFGLLGGVFYLLRGRGNIWQTFIDIGILACGSELVQLFIDGRSALVGVTLFVS